MRIICVFLMVVFFFGCAESARDSLEGARGALSESRYADAIAYTDAGLTLAPDEVTAWGLELIRLEALARAGRGDDVMAQIQKLAEARPEQVAANQYSATADQLRSAEQGAAAIQVMDLGLKRFPDDADLTALLEDARSAPAEGSDELRMLRSLGYVE